jgi:hypothetical protein
MQIWKCSEVKRWDIDQGVQRRGWSRPLGLDLLLDKVFGPGLVVDIPWVTLE